MNIDKLILEAKKRGKKVNPWAVCTASIGEKIGSTERSEWTKSQKEKYERCVLDVKKKQNIKENTINEVGGYDDPMMFAMHAGGQSGHLKGSYNALSEILNHLNNLKSEPVIDDNLKIELDNFLTDIEVPMKNLSNAIINFEKKNLGNFRGGRPKPRDLDESFSYGKVILTEEKLNNTLLTEGWKDILLGIALLTGVGLSKGNAQTAKQTLSKDQARDTIEATLKNDSLLDKITKDLPPEIQQKIQQNADKAIVLLGKNKSRVLPTVNVKNEKELQQRIKQGYFPYSMNTKTDTIQGSVQKSDTIVNYVDDVELTFGSDGLFVTGGYKLSDQGVQTIQNIKDSIQSVGGVIDSVYIESSTDTEPIKMGNQKLSELRAESVSKYFSDSQVDISTLPNQGPDVYSTTMTKEERTAARQQTAPYRYVKITISATFPIPKTDTLTTTTTIPKEVVTQNTYKLFKVVEKGGGNVKRKHPPRKKHHRNNKKSKCSGKVNCFSWGNPKNFNF